MSRQNLDTEEAKKRRREKAKEWREMNREKIKKTQAKWRAKNKEKIREASRRYDSKPEQKAKRKVYLAAWLAKPENAARERERRKRWGKENRDHINRYAKRYFKDPVNRARQRAATKKWREKPGNRERDIAKSRAWQEKIKADPVKLAALRERQRKSNKASAERAKRDPERLERLKASKHAGYKRRISTPEGKAKFAASRKRWYEAMRADPAKREHHEEMAKARAEKKRARDKLRRSPRDFVEYKKTVFREMPRSVLPDFREDVCSEVMTAIFVGDIQPSQIKEKLAFYIAKVRKQSTDRRATFSLDDEIPGTDGVKFVDLIESDRPHF